MSGHILSKSVTPKSSPGCKNGIIAGSRATGLTSSGETGDLGGVRGLAGREGAGLGLTHREVHACLASHRVLSGVTCPRLPPPMLALGLESSRVIGSPLAHHPGQFSLARPKCRSKVEGNVKNIPLRPTLPGGPRGSTARLSKLPYVCLSAGRATRAPGPGSWGPHFKQCLKTARALRFLET